jgi:spore germination cell wall hydrolase CwlJ-like protein
MTDATIGSVSYKFSADLSNFDAGLNKAGQSIANLSGKLRSGAAGMQASLDATAKSARLAKHELTNLGYQLGDVIATGLSFQTLMQQGPQVFQILAASQAGVVGGLKDIARLTASAVIGVKGLGVATAAAGVVAGAALLKWTAQADALSNALNGIGRRTGLGPQGLAAAADQGRGLAGNAFGGLTTGAARDLAAVFARAGVSGQAIPGLISAVPRFAGITGTDRDEAAVRLANALAEPVKGLDDLNKALGFADAALAENVRNLVAAGNTSAAQKVVVEALTKDLAEASEAVNSAAKAFRDVRSGLGNFFSSIGQGLSRQLNPTDEEALADLKKRRDELVAAGNSTLGRFLGGSTTGLDEVNAEIARIEKAIAEREKKAKDDAAKQEANRLSFIKKAADELRAQSDALVKSIGAVTLGQKAAVDAEMARVQALKAGKSELEAAAEAEKVRATALAQASREIRDAARDARDRLSIAGLRPVQAALAQNEIDRRRALEKYSLGSQTSTGNGGGASTPRGAIGTGGVTPRQISAAERDLFIRTVFGEAGGEGPVGQQAVANVILNRLNSGRYGRTFTDVITAKAQFNGSPTDARFGGKARELSEGSAAYRSIGQIVDDVLSGRLGDVTGGARNFYNPALASPEWARGRDGLTIGNHRFLGGRTGTISTGGSATTPGTVLDGAAINRTYDDIAKAIRTNAIEGILRAETDALNEEATAFEALRDSAFKSTAELAKIAEVQKLTNQFLREGIEITPELSRSIEDIATKRGALEGLRDQFGQLRDAARDFADQLSNGFIDVIFNGGKVTDVLRNIAKSLASDALRGLFRSLLGVGGGGGLFGGDGSGGGLGGIISGLFGNIFGGFRAEGGPVSPGAAYVVGERRPELFVPKVPGVIVPRVPNIGAAVRSAQSAQTASASGPPVFNIDARGAQAGVAEQIVRALRQYSAELPRQLPGMLATADRRFA